MPDGSPTGFHLASRQASILCEHPTASVCRDQGGNWLGGLKTLVFGSQWLEALQGPQLSDREPST